MKEIDASMGKRIIVTTSQSNHRSSQFEKVFVRIESGIDAIATTHHFRTKRHRKNVTHVPGLMCYPCSRSFPATGDERHARARDAPTTLRERVVHPAEIDAVDVVRDNVARDFV